MLVLHNYHLPRNLNSTSFNQYLVDIEKFISDYIRDPVSQKVVSAVNFDKDIKPIAVEVDDRDFISKQTVRLNYKLPQKAG